MGKFRGQSGGGVRMLDLSFKLDNEIFFESACAPPRLI